MMRHRTQAKQSVPWRFAGLFICFTLISAAVGATQSETNNAAKPPDREIAPGIVEIGQVRVNKEERSLSFPAAINMTTGAVEYLLVSAVGKLHESVLRTDVDPMHIHLGALLLGAKGAQTNLTVHDFNTKDIPGEAIDLLVEWSVEGQTKQSRAEETVFNIETKALMSTGPWVYNGSQLHGGTLVAQRDGLIVAIMSDPLALMNSPRKGRENDEIWEVNAKAVPQVNTPVRFIIKFKNDKQ